MREIAHALCCEWCCQVLLEHPRKGEKVSEHIASPCCWSRNHAGTEDYVAQICPAIHREADIRDNRNIILSATFSLLCAVEHKSDAATGEHGDLLDIIASTCRFPDHRDVLDEARRFLNLSSFGRTDDVNHERLPSPEAARRLFAASRPIAGTLAEAYLRGRGVNNVCGLDALRFHPRCFYRHDRESPREHWPALIAAVTDCAGNLTGVQRTFLARDGSGKAPLPAPRKAIGALAGNAVRFGDALDVMIVGEGIETVLSL